MPKRMTQPTPSPAPVITMANAPRLSPEERAFWAERVRAVMEAKRGQGGST